MKAFIYLVTYCVCCVLLINYLIVHFPSLYFGKDDGEVAMILFTWLSSWILFFVIEKSFVRLFVGIVVGIFSYLAIFLFYFISHNNAFYTSAMGDNVIAFSLIFLYALYRIKKNKIKREGAVIN